jgi:hypothetical protein
LTSRPLSPLERYRLLLATMLPRPIAWVTTREARGAVNLAPFSFFNVFGSDPATVGIGIGSKKPGGPKDTRANIRANAQFVVNLVPFALAEEMRVKLDLIGRMKAAGTRGRRNASRRRRSRSRTGSARRADERHAPARQLASGPPATRSTSSTILRRSVASLILEKLRISASPSDEAAKSAM